MHTTFSILIQFLWFLMSSLRNSSLILKNQNSSYGRVSFCYPKVVNMIYSQKTSVTKKTCAALNRPLSDIDHRNKVNSYDLNKKKMIKIHACDEECDAKMCSCLHVPKCTQLSQFLLNFYGFWCHRYVILHSHSKVKTAPMAGFHFVTQKW